MVSAIIYFSKEEDKKIEYYAIKWMDKKRLKKISKPEVVKRMVMEFDDMKGGNDGNIKKEESC